MRGTLKLFAKSPFGLLVRHPGPVRETVHLLRPLLEAFVAGDHARVVEV